MKVKVIKHKKSPAPIKSEQAILKQEKIENPSQFVVGGLRYQKKPKTSS